MMAIRLPEIGEINFLSIYGWTGEGASDRNVDLVRKALKAGDGANGNQNFVLGGDFNVTPGQLWPNLGPGRASKSRLLSLGGLTCFTNYGAQELDFLRGPMASSTTKWLPTGLWSPPSGWVV